MKTWGMIAALLMLAACDVPNASNIWGKERGITGVWGQEKEDHCTLYGSCGGGAPAAKACEIYGNCDE